MEVKGTYIANFTNNIKSLSFWGHKPEESHFFRYFADAQYDVVLKIFSGICYINPK